MRISWEEYQKLVTLEAVLYSIEVYFPKVGLTKQDKDSILSSLHRYRKKDSQVSFLYVESTTDKVTGSKLIKTGKPGRPRKVPIGKKVAEHVHIAVIGTINKSAYTCAMKVKKAIDKRFIKKGARCKRSKVVSKGNTGHAINYIGYCFEQADLKRTAGDFDFYGYSRYPNISE